MNLEATRDKLEEAKFFLLYLDEAQNQPQSQTQTPFRYYLSAFLGAIYSVQQYLQTEVIRAVRQQARTQGKKLSDQHARPHYNKFFTGWFTALPPEHQDLWESLMNNRGSEIHTERTKTVTKEKAIPAYPSPHYPYRSECSWAFAAHFVTQLQEGAPFYPDIAETTKQDIGLPLGTNAWVYIQEHHHKIGGVLQATVKTCTEYVALLESLINHFEQSAP
jgi:hypothetical protein